MLYFLDTLWRAVAVAVIYCGLLWVVPRLVD